MEVSSGPIGKSKRIKQSLAWWCFAPSTSPEQIVKEAAAIGISGVEVPPREQWDMIIENNLKIISDIGHGTLTDGLNCRENHDRIEEELQAKIETAAKYNIPNLVCFSGSRRDLSDGEGIENTAGGLLRVAKLAESKKVTLWLELVNSKIDHPDYHGDHTLWGIEVCKRVDSPAVKILYDVYHMQIMEGDLTRTIQQNIDYIGHFHIAGNPGRSNIDDTQEINYRGVIQAIAATNYAGYIGHEYIPEGDAMQVLRQTFELCNM